jgi:two-component system chemotaxis sensor kinase CheA
MPIDLKQFHEAFYEESFDAIGVMEAALLRVQVSKWDGELIHSIFRAAHSIKGGAATFGFDSISSFTHSLEALLDGLRAERLRLTEPLRQLLLRSIDVLREMLTAQRSRQPFDSQRAVDLQFEIELAASQQRQAEAVAEARLPSLASSSLDGKQDRSVRRYQMSFRPRPQLFVRRTEPLRLFRELRALGQLQIKVDAAELPPLHELDPQSCYLSWTLELTSSAAREAVLEVFEWTQGDGILDLRELGEDVELDAHVPRTEPAAASGPASAPVGGSARSADLTSIRVSVEKIDQLMNSVGELVITQSMLAQLGTQLEGAGGERVRAGLEQLEHHVRALQEDVMRVRMVPIGFVFNRFPRMVHDLSQQLGKHVQLKISGAETELDKSVLEHIGDPLTHLVRNCIDHGIETTAQRRASGKPATGSIHLHACYHGSKVRLEISDDGAGLSRERILVKAREHGLQLGDSPSDEAVFNLIFLAGFSTAEGATLVSGRGVGMDVVRRNLETLGGRIELQSRAGQGTRFIITLPPTLAIVDGQAVAVGEELYIVPLTAMVESLQMRTAPLQQLLGRGQVLSFRGEYVPVVRLERLLSSRRARASEPGSEIIAVVEADGRRVGLVVDQLLGQQQVVVKTLETNYGSVEGIAGATILGDGSVALILDIERLTRALAEELAA